MNVIVRFYWQHDLDLIALSMHPDFEMGRWMKKAIVAYARGDANFVIPMPRPQPYRVELDSCSVHFALAPNKEDDVIDFMCGFRYGFRNAAIKQIFRQYLERPNMDVYFNEQMYAAKARGTKVEGKTLDRIPEILSREEKLRNVEALNRPVTQKKEVNEEIVTQVKKHAQNLSEGVTDTNKETIHKDVAIHPSISKVHMDNKENEKEPEFDLSAEENEEMQGDVFNLFSAVDKLF